MVNLEQLWQFITGNKVIAATLAFSSNRQPLTMLAVRELQRR
jgi:hypothetical protein